MDVINFNQSTYADLFPSTDADVKTAKFGASSEDVNLFAPPASTTESTTEAPVSTTDDTTLPVSTTDQTSVNDTNLFPADDDKKPAKDKDLEDKSGILDLPSYFEDRLKSGKFVSIVDEGADGKTKNFIPKTADEFDEVIDIQVNHRLEEQKANIDKQWYESKSPAWQAVAKYAEMTDDPSEILPFLQGVRQIDSVKDLDPADADQAERIIRTRLQQKGDTEDLIDEQISTLKDADKLAKTAQVYKPLILEQERKQLAQMVQEKEKEEEEWNQVVMGVRENAIKAIEAPIYGKQKLKNDEKSAVFSLIGLPAKETKGYPIYNEIDRLFAQGDFETLTKLALLIAKKDSFIGYISAGAADKTAEGLQRKLRVATESNTSGASSSNEDTERKTVKRNAYSTTPKFGMNQ